MSANVNQEAKKELSVILHEEAEVPYAKERTNKELERAYAHVAKTSWPMAINQMHDRLVSMGFDEVEAAKYVQPEVQPPLIPPPSVPTQLTWTMREAPQLGGLPDEVRSSVNVTTTATGYKVTLHGVMSADAEAKLVEAMPKEEREAVRQSLAARREQILQKLPEPVVAPPFRVPQLCVWVDGALELVNDEHFLTPDSWNLLDYPAELSEAEFRIEERSDSYLIDIQGLCLVERHLGSQSALAFADVPTNVTDLQLSRELEKELRRPGLRPEMLLEYIRRTVRWLVDSRKMSVTTLTRARFGLEKALHGKIEGYRQKALDSGYQLRLFGEAAQVETSYKYEFVFPADYPAITFYKGGFKFPKHLYGEDFVGEFDTTPECECAKALEMCPQVKRWVRNVVGLFSLPTAKGNFYPDFVAELTDGRMLIVEYKGDFLIEHEQQKKNIGERWESKSDGKALFLWAIKKDAQGRDVRRQLRDKVEARKQV